MKSNRRHFQGFVRSQTLQKRNRYLYKSARTSVVLMSDYIYLRYTLQISTLMRSYKQWNETLYAASAFSL